MHNERQDGGMGFHLQLILYLEHRTLDAGEPPAIFSQHPFAPLRTPRNLPWNASSGPTCPARKFTPQPVAQRRMEDFIAPAATPNPAWAGGPVEAFGRVTAAERTA